MMVIKMTKVKVSLIISILCVFTLVAGACTEKAPIPEPIPTPAPSGTVNVYVTDAPPREEVTSIIVTLSELQIHKAGAEQEREQEQADTGNETQEQEQQVQENGGEWITIDLSDNATTFDLLKIKGIEQYIGTKEVEESKYTQIRLFVDKIQVKLRDGDLQDAIVPSGELKIVRPFNVVAGENTTLVLDFEADKMVNITGSGKIMVKPVVKLEIRQGKEADKQKGNGLDKAQLEDKTWVLKSYGEPGKLKDVLQETEITATFNSDEGQVNGSAGCNHYFGAYEAGKEDLSITGPIGATEMWCGELKDTQEREYLSTLQAAESYEIEEDQLTIYCGNQVLIFEVR